VLKFWQPKLQGKHFQTWQGSFSYPLPRFLLRLLGTGPITVAQQVEQKVTLIIEPKLWLCVRVVPDESLN